VRKKMAIEKSSIILITSSDRIMVENLPHYPKVEGSSPVFDTSPFFERKKMFYNIDGQYW
jgi:hypothetical protein